MHFGYQQHKYQAQRHQTQMSQWQIPDQINYSTQNYKNQYTNFQQYLQYITQKPQVNKSQRTQIDQSYGKPTQAVDEQNQKKQMMQHRVKQLLLYNKQLIGNQSQKVQIPNCFNDTFTYQLPNLITQESCVQYQYKKFDDDDPIIKNNIQSIKINEVQPKVHLQLESLYQKGRLIENQSQSLPACITISNDENKSQFQQTIDLICVIDKFECMLGSKVQHCQNFLLCLLEHLTHQDRLCIIQEGNRITPLKCVTDVNKPYFRNAIQSMEQSGNDNPQLLNLAIQQIQERKYKNDKTLIFWVSDGQQYYVKEQLSFYLDQFEFPIIINTFGFGKDHDSQLLTYIASLTNGKFYFIDRYEQLADFFTDSLSKVVSTVATKVQILLECQDNRALQFRIKKLYGNQWKLIQKDRKWLIELEQIQSGVKLDYMFEIFIPKQMQKVSQDRHIQIAKATIKYKSQNTNNIVEDQKNLELLIVDDIIKLNDNKRNKNVALQFARVQTAEIIEKANQIYQYNQSAYFYGYENFNFNEYQKAQNLLSQQLKNLQQFELKDIQFLCLDIKEAEKVFKQMEEGECSRGVMRSNYNDQRYQYGIQTQFVNRVTYMQPQQGSYRNQTQLTLVQQFQQSR